MIEIYGKPDCGYCSAAKELMKINNVEYKEYVIGQDLTREEFIEKFPTMKTVPTILLDGNLIGGYNELLEHISKKVQNGS